MARKGILKPATYLRQIREVHQRRKPMEEEWIDNVRWLNNKFGGASLEEEITVNMFWTTLRSIIPSIYFRDPEAICQARNPAGEDRAPILQAVINYNFEKVKLKRKIQKMLPDAFCYPFAVGKLGYKMDHVDAEVVINKKTGDIVDLYDKTIQVDLTETRH